jgi:Na+-translocating ferredoxin:NAD+ oxidoreductase RnfG subunit
MRNPSWLWLPLVAVSTSVYAKSYFTLEQAQQAIFPGAKLVEAFVTLTDAQKREIEQRSGVNVRSSEMRLWRVVGGGYFVVDEVVGKHELITYAVGLTAEGAVKQIEIMDYRENYGYEIRNARWRDQFTGKTSASPLKVDTDIQNISGATLSCRHVTEGVRRVLASYETAFK